jgi:AcrR family transcriptional regulator
MNSQAEQPIFAITPALPRGPHRLTRDEVAASQRTRMMAALTSLLAERGYAAITIGDLAARAGVSRAAFYEHFADKQACLLAAYDHFAITVAAAIAIPPKHDTPWSAFIDATLEGYLGVLQRDLTAARAFLVEMDAAGREARARRREAMHAFAALIAERHATIRAQDPTLGPLPFAAYLALVLGVREVVHDALDSDPRPRLMELKPDLALLAIAIAEGAGAAQAHRAS